MITELYEFHVHLSQF